MNPISVLKLHAASYTPHFLHAEQCVWQEKNCYIDLWIEVLHALKLDPLPLLAFTVRLDFLDDQWLFYKPPHADIEELYGIDVQELTVWRPLLEHAVTQLERGRLIFTEADSFFLPDTHGTDYRSQHTKTTICIESIDLDCSTIGYFHNKGYYVLGQDDFAALTRSDAAQRETLPFFAELVRLDRIARHNPKGLLQLSEQIFRHHLAWRPQDNPFQRYLARFPDDLRWLMPYGVATYHAYAFATLRQIGSNFELLAHYLRWLARAGYPELEAPSTHFARISETAQTLILKGARAVNGKKEIDLSPQLELMAQSWQDGMGSLVVWQDQ